MLYIFLCNQRQSQRASWSAAKAMSTLIVQKNCRTKSKYSRNIKKKEESDQSLSGNFISFYSKIHTRVNSFVKLDADCRWLASFTPFVVRSNSSIADRVEINETQKTRARCKKFNLTFRLVYMWIFSTDFFCCPFIHSRWGEREVEFQQNVDESVKCIKKAVVTRRARRTREPRMNEF